MPDDDLELRCRPAAPYRRGASLLLVPADALEATLALLHVAGDRESCVFWYGRRGPDASTVEAVRAPDQQVTRFNFHVEASAMSGMAATLHDDWRPLAQIHTHPGRGVEHSGYDDRMVASRRALSLVFPFYGRWSGRFPDGIGVHEWQDGGWHLLGPADARARVRLAPAAGVDARDLR